ncbi:hypothetical protein ASPSYDRAFT_50425, partial [Aspergillus sydowii CBS 593.65]
MRRQAADLVGLHRAYLSRSKFGNPNYLGQYQTHRNRSCMRNGYAETGNHLIWLPPQYRETAALVRENTVILGHQSGALTFIWL